MKIILDKIIHKFILLESKELSKFFILKALIKKIIFDKIL